MGRFVRRRASYRSGRSYGGTVHFSSSQSNKIAIVVSLIIGVVFAFTGIGLLIQSRQRAKYYIATTAIIDDIDVYVEEEWDDDGYWETRTYYDVYVDYEVNSVKYNDVFLDSYSSSMYEGAEIRIYYDSRDPSKISYNLTNWTSGAICTAVGAVGLGVAVFFIVKQIKSKYDEPLIDHSPVDEGV